VLASICYKLLGGNELPNGHAQKEFDVAAGLLGADEDALHRAFLIGGDLSGQGVGLCLGRKLDLVLASLTPEVGGSYHAFRGTGEAHLKQAFVGGRFRLGKVLEPGVYAHIGYGWLDVNGAMAGSDGISGVSADAGASLDLTLLPMLDLKIHAGYNGILANADHSAFDTYVLGLNAGLVF